MILSAFVPRAFTPTIGLALVLGCGGKSLILGENGGCQICRPECRNDLATHCRPLNPPACGSQTAPEFCPYGCSPDIPGTCNVSPTDGAAPSSCRASFAVIQQGELSSGGSERPVAATRFLAAETHVVVATSAGVACTSTSDGGGAPLSGSGVLLVLSLPANFAGEITVGSGASARLRHWANGGLVDDQLAISGSAWLSLSQPGGGTIGSYDLTFDSSVERGTFVAPACDLCAASP
jgi:hypothetical protein